MPARFTGGAKFKEALREAAQRLSNADTLRVGVPEDATYPDGTSVGLVAAIQEFGAPSRGIPPRPFFRTMIAKESSSWPGTLGQALQANGYDARVALKALGEDIANALQESILTLTEPALSPVTLMLRQMREGRQDAPVTIGMVRKAAARVARGESATGVFTKPLVDSGILLQGIVAEVN